MSTEYDNLVKQGLLRKKGHIRKNWKTRWFKLTNQTLSYYKSSDESKPLGVIHLKYYTIHCHSERTEMIVLKCNIKAPVHKDYFIIAENENVKQSWLKAIGQVIDNLNSNQSELSKPVVMIKSEPMVMNTSTKDSQISEGIGSSSVPTKSNNIITYTSSTIIRRATDKIVKNEIKKVNNSVGNLETVKRIKRRSELIEPPISAISSGKTSDQKDKLSPSSSSRRPSLTNIMKPIRRLSSGSIDFISQNNDDVDIALKKISVGMGFIYGSVQWQSNFELDNLDAIYNEHLEQKNKRKSYMDLRNRPLPTPPTTSNEPEEDHYNYTEDDIDIKIEISEENKIPNDVDVVDNLESNLFMTDSLVFTYGNGTIENEIEIQPSDSSQQILTNKSIRNHDQRMSLSAQLIESLKSGELYDALEKEFTGNNNSDLNDQTTIVENQVQENNIEDKPVEEKKDQKSFIPFGYKKPRENREVFSQTSSHRNLNQYQIRTKQETEEREKILALADKLISKEDPLKIYDCYDKSIGKGGMGEVFIGKRIDNSERVAIKKLATYFKGKDRLPTILNEINVMSNSKHENIVNYIASYRVGDELWVCMEYMDKGSLYDLVRLGVKINETYLAYIIKSILEALKYIHEMKRIHRDIKVDNVLLSSKGTIKLADFGAAVQLTFQRLKRSTMTGTPYYMSPEVIEGKLYDELVDIWSLGILCIELATHSPPYYDLPPELAIEKILQSGVEGLDPKKFSPEFVDFVNNRCLKVKPSERWTSKQLLDHPWLNKACTRKEFSSWLKNVHGLETDSFGCKIL